MTFILPLSSLISGMLLIWAVFLEYRCLNLRKEGFDDPEQFENIIASSGIDITRSKTNISIIVI